MPGKMDDMINKTNHLNQIVDLQAEMLPFEGLLKPEYGRDLAPIPFDLMPYAKKSRSTRRRRTFRSWCTFGSRS